MAQVTIRCIADNPHALAGVLNTKKVRFDIEGRRDDDVETKRTQLNLALILDRSGSMESNEKLTFAKRAIISVLNLLNDDDIVHLIAYESDVSVIFENARAVTREILFPLIEQIQTAGSTNISGALNIASQLLDKYPHPGSSRRMFLFSDGQANVGLRTRAELTQLVTSYHRQGILTDSFGIGADFDPEIMKGIADAGGSRFFFLESFRVIEPFVSKALMSVFSVCASQAQLKIRGRNGTVLTKIFGHDNLVDGAQLGDLHSKSVRSILCEFNTSGQTNPQADPIECLTYELRYNQPDDLHGEPIVIQQSLSLTFVDDDSLVKEIDPRVKTMSVTQMAADMDIKIADLVKQNQINDAITLVNEQINLLKSVEQFDDERGMISLLIRIAENMAKKLNVDDLDRELVCQGYQHQCYLKRTNSCSYMEDFGLYE